MVLILSKEVITALKFPLNNVDFTKNTHLIYSF